MLRALLKLISDERSNYRFSHNCINASQQLVQTRQRDIRRQVVVVGGRQN